jgi:hypothetical protein
MKLRTASLLALIALSITGCKAKKKYSPSCQRSTTLTAPWDGYALPTSGGRVCSSDQARAEMQYLSGDRASWEKSYETALVAAGFAKDRCTNQSCTFKRGDEKATVQVIEAKKWVTVVVRR